MDLQSGAKIYEFLEYLSKSLGETVPDCYINLLYEIAKNTPISGIFQSSSRTFPTALKSFLDENLDIFDDKELWTICMKKFQL